MFEIVAHMNNLHIPLLIFHDLSLQEGIEILTDKRAGKRQSDGIYPKGTINYLVDEKLKELAEGLKKFGVEQEKEEKTKRRGKRGNTKKK